MVHHHDMVENQSARWVKGEHQLKICNFWSGVSLQTWGWIWTLHNDAQCCTMFVSMKEWLGPKFSQCLANVFRFPAKLLPRDRMDLIWFDIRLHRNLLHMSACFQYELSYRLWCFWGGLSFVSVWRVSPPSSLQHVAFYGKGMPALGTQWKALLWRNYHRS